MNNPKFKIVLADLIDPDLKIRATFGRFDLDSGTVTINLYYDPEISDANLTMPMPPVLANIWARHNAGPVPDVVFTSEQSQKITSIIVRVDEDFEEITLKVQSDLDGFSYKAALIEQYGSLSTSGCSHHIILDIIKKIVLLPIWLINYPATKSISIHIDRVLAKEFTQACGAVFPNDGDDDVLIAMRRVGA